MKPLRFDIELVPAENPLRYVRGMTMVGCLAHDNVVWSPFGKDWKCPECGYRPPEEAYDHPLIISAVDFANGTITVR